MKPCNVCKISKPLIDYPRVSRARRHIGDGHEARCKQCQKEYMLTRRDRDNELRRIRNATEDGRLKKNLINKRYFSTEKGKAVRRGINARYKAKNPEKFKAMTTASRKKYQSSDKFKAAHKKSRRKFMFKHYARLKLQYAVRNGIIIKPINCENCTTISPLEGHHHDYNKPLIVTWLCKSCHESLHHL